MELGPLEDQDDLLDYPFFYLDHEPETLRNQLDIINEDIEDAEWEVEDHGGGTKTLNKLIIWTNKSVIFPYNFLGDTYLAKIKRNP